MKVNGSTTNGIWNRKSKNIFVRSDGVIAYRRGEDWLVKDQHGNFLFDEPVRTHVRARQIADEVLPLKN